MNGKRLQLLATTYTAGEIAQLSGIPVGKVRAMAKREGIKLAVGLRHGYKKERNYETAIQA